MKATHKFPQVLLERIFKSSLTWEERTQKKIPVTFFSYLLSSSGVCDDLFSFSCIWTVWHITVTRLLFKLIKGLIVSVHLSKLSDTMYNGLCTQSPDGTWGSSYYSAFSPHLTRHPAGLGQSRGDERGYKHSYFVPLAFHCGSFSSLVKC